MPEVEMNKYESNQKASFKEKHEDVIEVQPGHGEDSNDATNEIEGGKLLEKFASNHLGKLFECK